MSEIAAVCLAMRCTYDEALRLPLPVYMQVLQAVTGGDE